MGVTNALVLSLPQFFVRGRVPIKTYTVGFIFWDIMARVLLVTNFKANHTKSTIRQMLALHVSRHWSSIIFDCVHKYLLTKAVGECYVFLSFISSLSHLTLWFTIIVEAGAQQTRKRAE